MERSTLITLVLQTLKSFMLPAPGQILPDLCEDTVLFGRDGLLDSTALVSFILDVEEAIRIECGISITLADERAMSQNRSPFRRVSSLVDYAHLLLAEQKPNQK
jgi:hypothetical protein